MFPGGGSHLLSMRAGLAFPSPELQGQARSRRSSVHAVSQCVLSANGCTTRSSAHNWALSRVVGSSGPVDPRAGPSARPRIWRSSPASGSTCGGLFPFGHRPLADSPRAGPDAARVDGCVLRRFRHIVTPMIFPILIIGFLFTVFALSDLSVVYLWPRGPTRHRSACAAYRSAFRPAVSTAARHRPHARPRFRLFLMLRNLNRRIRGRQQPARMLRRRSAPPAALPLLTRFSSSRSSPSTGC